MRIEDIADVYQGITLSRIRNSKNDDIEKTLIYSFIDGGKRYIMIPKDKESNSEIPFTKKDMILLNITSFRASIIEEHEEGMVIPSTFIILSAKDGVNPIYLEWYINEGQAFYKSLYLIKQGSVITSIPIQSLREIEVDIPSIEIQNKIANMSNLMKQRKKLLEKKEKLFKDILKYINQEAMKNDK